MFNEREVERERDRKRQSSRFFMIANLRDAREEFYREASIATAVIAIALKPALLKQSGV